MELKQATYGIVGLGIMGGSFAKSIRQNILSQAGSSGKILVCNRSTACLSQALSEGVADKTFTSDNVASMLPECDVVFVCLYPHATLDFMKEHREHFKKGAIVTDISGVKGIFEKSMPEILRPDVDFIIGHPMAGGEKEGYANSDARFFVNHNYILCPSDFNKAENLDFMRSLVAEMGFTRITETTCDTHDWKIGFTSQLCHVIASALVESAEDPEITAFGGGSFEDLTRIAMINAPLWTELFISNKEKLVTHIENFEKQMERFKTYIKEENAEALRDMLSHTREQRLKMGSIRTVKK
ncbi:MAG: prephenate dehydrogenase [Treponema sp.]|uniref:prephenate dehydrogenase n=1 Tax=Treponema sp. TaxID=166 RepID=UPI0025F8E2CB|nr:prephenate dehydrogenase [Treponema sp.]MBQ9282206.1 prephenate dehydrogenase [Treponema sp.]